MLPDALTLSALERGEIDRYLDKDLLPEVEEILSGREDESTRSRQQELAKLEAIIADAGMDPSISTERSRC